jgi:hypothetical protein
LEKVSLFKKYGALNSLPVFRAFEYSLTNAGYQVVDDSYDADVAVIWSNIWHGRMYDNLRVWEHFRNQNKNVIILEVGAVKRGVTWKIGLNGLKPDNLIYEIRKTDSYGLKLSKWKSSGDHILICGQHDKSNFWKGMPKQDVWINDCVDIIRKHTDKKIIVRQHPRCVIKQANLKNVEYSIPLKIPKTYDDFDISFKKCASVISWSGSAGPHAAIAGVPVFCGPDSFASPVGNKDFENILNPETPDRTEWFKQFLSSEYTIPEIKMGMPLKILTNYI